MIRGQFDNNDVNELSNRFMAELDERWNAMNIPNDKRFFNFN